MDLPAFVTRMQVPSELALIVGWHQGAQLVGGEVRVAAAVGQHLQAACQRTVAQISALDPRHYSPDMHLEAEEVLFITNAAETIADSAVAAVVLPTSPLPLVDSQSLPTRPLQFYAVNTIIDGAMTAFVRKTSPRAPAKAGEMFAMLGPTLTKIGQPVFCIDDHFDLIVTEDTIVSTNQLHFEQLFRETPDLQQRIPEWVAAISSHLPLSGDGAKRLTSRAQTDGRLRRRLRSIAERGHLATVTVARVREHLQAAGLPEDRFLRGDELFYDDDRPFDIVYLLNEDFFQGGLTDSSFRSDRKSPR